MRNELDIKLMKRFGFLYRDRSRPMTETCMCWGFDCGDGWFDILWKLSTDIEALLETIPEKDRDNFAVNQVKEKFGGLRYYCSAPPAISEKIFDLVDKAERLSYETCENCGKPGKPNSDGWTRTECGACKKRREAA